MRRTLSLGLLLFVVGCSEPMVQEPAIDEVRSVGQPNENPPATSPNVDTTYVQGVLDRLEVVRTEVMTDKLNGRPPRQDKIDAIYAGGAREFQSHNFDDAGPPIEGFVDADPAPMSITVVELPLVTPTCIWVRADVHQRHNSIDENRPGMRADYVLEKIGHDTAINPTPWVMTEFTDSAFELIDEDNACD